MALVSPINKVERDVGQRWLFRAVTILRSLLLCAYGGEPSKIDL